MPQLAQFGDQCKGVTFLVGQVVKTRAPESRRRPLSLLLRLTEIVVLPDFWQLTDAGRKKREERAQRRLRERNSVCAEKVVEVAVYVPIEIAGNCIPGAAF